MAIWNPLWFMSQIKDFKTADVDSHEYASILFLRTGYIRFFGCGTLFVLIISAHLHRPDVIHFKYFKPWLITSRQNQNKYCNA